MTTILDPTDERVPVTRQLTPRSGTVSGRVALLDISKPKGNVLLDRLEQVLAAQLPGGDADALRKADLFQACTGCITRRNSAR